MGEVDGKMVNVGTHAYPLYNFPKICKIAPGMTCNNMNMSMDQPPVMMKNAPMNPLKHMENLPVTWGDMGRMATIMHDEKMRQVPIPAGQLRDRFKQTTIAPINKM